MSGLSPWFPALVDRLRVLWEEGYTASQIGRKIGFSREAVCGKARRVWLTERGATGNRQPRIPKVVKVVIPKPKPTPPPDGAPPSRNLSIESLGPTTCRYPYGTAAPYSFCGAFPASGSVYCIFHRSICVTPPKTSAV